MLFYALYLLLPLVYTQDILFPQPSNDPNLGANIDNENYSPQTAYSQIEESQNNDNAKNLNKGVLNSINEIGLKINRIESDTYRNYRVVSPTSIACALYMILEGSNNDTYTQIYNFLGLNPLSYGVYQDYISNQLNKLSITGHENNIIKIANGLFVQQDFSIRQAYRDSLLNYFRATVQNLDFRNNGQQARDVINSYVNQSTFGKITDILTNVPNPDTKIILTNSLYFKGEWETPFPSQLTKIKDFYPYGLSHQFRTKVPIMAVGGTFKYYYDPILDAQVLGIPYKGREVVFYVVLPRESNVEKIKNLENITSVLHLEKILNNTKYTDDMIITLPKMKLVSEFDLIPSLQKLGVTSLFDVSKSDLSLISNTPNTKMPPSIFSEDSIIFSRSKAKRNVPKNGLIINPKMGTIRDSRLYVNQILHKIIIDINELGTEAAATTLVNIAKSMSLTIRVDTPFMFFLKHEPSNLILFQGTVLIPPV